MQSIRATTTSAGSCLLFDATPSREESSPSPLGLCDAGFVQTTCELLLIVMLVP